MSYLQIKKSELVPDTYGKHIKITMIGLYQDDGKYIKFVELNDALLEVLMNAKIELTPENL